MPYKIGGGISLISHIIMQRTQMQSLDGKIVVFLFYSFVQVIW